MISHRLEMFTARALDLRHPRIPAVVLVICATTFLVTCFAIMGTGFTPVDDANRHVAKVVSGRDWSDILVLRDDFIVDTHPAWHLLLSGLHRFGGVGKEGLLLFSVAAIFCLFAIVPLVFYRRPEAWLISCAIVAVASTESVRWMLGRPFMFTVFNTVLILLSVKALSWEKTHRGWFAGIAVSTALCTWFHSTTWFLYVMPLAACFVGGRFKAATRLCLAVGAGVILGLCLTGRPLALLFGMPIQVLASVNQGLLPSMRVNELQPVPFPLAYLLLVAIVVCLRKIFTGKLGGCLTHPGLILAAAGAVLCQGSARFWSDWGLIGMLVWLGDQIAVLLNKYMSADGLRRALLAGAVGCAFFISYRYGHDELWMQRLNLEYWSVEGAAPEEAEWFPEEGGIVYSPTMAAFYRCFYANPKAPWRYMLGFEPSLMPSADFDIYQRIIWNEGDVAAFRPWVAKMRPEDRFVVLQSSRPPLPELEWHLAVRKLWVGRVPRK